MATLAEIAKEVSDTLSQIEANTRNNSDTAAGIKGSLAELGAHLEGTKARLDAGLAFVGEGLFAILEAQRQANAHLATQVEHGDVILGCLATQARQLCRQLRGLHDSLAAHHDVLATLRTLEGMLGLVHARELVEHQRQHAQPEEPAPSGLPRSDPDEEADLELGREPKVSTHDPRGQDWDGQWKPPSDPGD